jgi:hypothetical protein
MIDLRHGEKTGELRRLIFKVRNELRAGWSEEVYPIRVYKSYNIHDTRKNNESN